MRKLMSTVTVATVALLAAGCSASSDKPKADSAPSNDPTTTATASETSSFPVTIKHAAGETEIKATPERIVVLDMAALDTLDAIGAGEHVVGVPAGSSIPSWLTDDEGINYSQVQSVGSLKEPDLEQIAKLNPDLVIVASRSASLYEEFAKTYPTLDTSVSWSEGDYVDNVKQQIEWLGQATGHGEQAAQAQQQIDEKVAQLKDKGKDKGKAMVLMSNASEISMHGPKSRWAPIFSVLGFTPVEIQAEQKSDEGHKGQKISFETVQQANPDWIFVTDRDAAVGQVEAGQTAQQVMDNDLVNSTKAATDGHIVYLSPERWYIVMAGATNFLAMLDEIGAIVK